MAKAAPKKKAARKKASKKSPRAAKKKPTLKSRAKKAGRKVKKAAKTDVGRAGIGAGAGAILLGPIGAAAGAYAGLKTRKKGKKGNPGMVLVRSKGKRRSPPRKTIARDIYRMDAELRNRNESAARKIHAEHKEAYSFLQRRDINEQVTPRNRMYRKVIALHSALAQKVPHMAHANPEPMVKVSSTMGSLLLDYYKASADVEHVAASALHGEKVALSSVVKARNRLAKMAKSQPMASEEEQIGNLVEALDKIIARARKGNPNVRAFSLETQLKRQRQSKAKEAMSRAASHGKVAREVKKKSTRRKIEAATNPKATVRKKGRFHKAYAPTMEEARAFERKYGKGTQLDKLTTKYRRSRDKWIAVAGRPHSTPGEIARAKKKADDDERRLILYASTLGIDPADFEKYMEHALTKEAVAKTRKRKKNPGTGFPKKVSYSDKTSSFTSPQARSGGLSYQRWFHFPGVALKSDHLFGPFRSKVQSVFGASSWKHDYTKAQVAAKKRAYKGKDWWDIGSANSPYYLEWDDGLQAVFYLKLHKDQPNHLDGKWVIRAKTEADAKRARARIAKLLKVKVGGDISREVLFGLPFKEKTKRKKNPSHGSVRASREVFEDLGPYYGRPDPMPYPEFHGRHGPGWGPAINAIFYLYGRPGKKAAISTIEKKFGRNVPESLVWAKYAKYMPVPTTGTGRRKKVTGSRPIKLTKMGEEIGMRMKAELQRETRAESEWESRTRPQRRRAGRGGRRASLGEMEPSLVETLREYHERPATTVPWEGMEPKAYLAGNPLGRVTERTPDKKFREKVSRNIAIEMHAGKPQKQAVAIALSTARKQAPKKTRKLYGRAPVSNPTPNPCLGLHFHGKDADELMEAAEKSAKRQQKAVKGRKKNPNGGTVTAIVFKVGKRPKKVKSVWSATEIAATVGGTKREFVRVGDDGYMVFAKKPRSGSERNDEATTTAGKKGHRPEIFGTAVLVPLSHRDEAFSASIGRLSRYGESRAESNPRKKKVAKKKATRRKTPPYQLLINRCQKLWSHYCERPSKKRLEAIYVHLDKMKASTSQKVKTERSKCLRAANAEAKRLKYKRK